MKQKGVEILRETFFELALCLEVIFLIHGAGEDLVEEVMRVMEELYKNAVRALKELDPGDRVAAEGHSAGATSAYPAVGRFISMLKERGSHPA